MKVFVTGASGLLGAHTTLELLRSGHEVRLLVRNKEAAYSYFLAQGFDLKDFVVTDMLDKAAVKSGMQGCDAVIHIAAIVDLDARNAKHTQATNLQSIESVIGSACELGIEKIIYVSSMSVYYDFSQKMLTEESPLVDVKDAYSLSKKLCEIRIRELQAQGLPIMTTYPSAVFGPDDPKLAESNRAIVRFCESILPLTSSGMQFIDARDIGIAHRLLIESQWSQDKTQERYILGGTYMSWSDVAELIERAAGKKITKVKVPGVIFRALGVVFDGLRIFVPIKFPISKESMRIITQLPPTTSDKLMAKTGMVFRPTEETLRDTIEWLKEAKYM